MLIIIDNFKQIDLSNAIIEIMFNLTRCCILSSDKTIEASKHSSLEIQKSFEISSCRLNIQNFVLRLQASHIQYWYVIHL